MFENILNFWCGSWDRRRSRALTTTWVLFPNYSSVSHYSFSYISLFYNILGNIPVAGSVAGSAEERDNSDDYKEEDYEEKEQQKNKHPWGHILDILVINIIKKWIFHLAINSNKWFFISNHGKRVFCWVVIALYTTCTTNVQLIWVCLV